MDEVLMADGAIKRQGDSLVSQGVVMHASRVGAMTVNNVTDTVIGFDTRDYDPYGWFNTVNGRFMPQYAGYYRISAQTLWTSASGRWNAWFRVNGVTYRRVADVTISGTVDHGVGGTDLVYLNGSTDYVEFGIWQNSGSAKSIIGGATYSFISAELVGATVGVVPEPWHIVGAPGEPAFQSGWVGYNNGLAFCKMPDNTVRFKGEAQAGTWTGGTPIFTLPAGYRPGWRLYPVVYANSSPFAGVIGIDTTGVVSVEQRPGTATHIHGFGAVSFRAEQ